MRSHRITLTLLAALVFHCGPGADAPVTATAPTATAPDAGLSAPEGGAIEAADGAAPMNTTTQAPYSDAASVRTDGCTPGGADQPDDLGSDTNCDGADGVVGVDVYVDPTAGQDTNDGSPKAPMQSLASALLLATARHGHILLAAGEVRGDSFPLTGTWSLYGGYGASFVGAPDRHVTVFAATARGLLIEDTTEGLLAHVTVKADRSGDAVQTSVHALKSRAAHLMLHDVRLSASDATDAPVTADALQGSQADEAGTCVGSPLPAYALGQPMLTSSPDAKTQPGSIDSHGGHPPSVASPGFPGTDGQDAPAMLQIAGDLLVGVLGRAGRANGNPGYGGAGGGYVPPYVFSKDAGFIINPHTIYGGKGGSGGCPGPGGQPAAGGGTSVALVVLAGKVDITQSQLQAGFGAAGGDGGQGGAGGFGSMGGLPEVSPSWPTMLPSTCTNTPPDALGLNCAAYGGQGGQGGAGGRGGAGAGGWSLGILAAPGALFSADQATIITVGKPGIGGQGSGGSGLAGRAALSYTLAP